MVVHKTDDFLNGLDKLPNDAKRLFKKQEAIFIKNWLDPRLHIKKLKDLEGVYSFRITRRYRVLFYFQDKDIVFFAVGHRREVYKKR
jgi:mRNA-degrading endonuclease RelE of RelBE toxin-antitoxin system